jgi:predicted dehydrogenase
VVPPAERATHRLLDPARGGGALMDVGIYPLNLASFLLGRTERVEASGTLQGDDLDLRTTMLMTHEGGAVSLLSAGIDFQGGSDARISGTLGSIGIEPRMHRPTAIVVEDDDGRDRIEFPIPGLGIQVPEVHRCLREGLLESPVMPWRESLSMHHLTDSIRSRIGLRFAADSP